MSGAFGRARRARCAWEVDENPEGFVAADLDGNLWADLATPNDGGDNVSAIVAGRSGSSVGATPSADVPLRALAAGELDGDGEADLVATAFHDDLLAIDWGDRAATSALGAAPLGITAADFNGDGIGDLVVTLPAAGQVAVSLSSVFSD